TEPLILKAFGNGRATWHCQVEQEQEADFTSKGLLALSKEDHVMNATARAVDGFNRGDTTARRAIQEPKPTLTRPVQRGTSSNQAINELTETLKRIMASATSLLGVPNCWIAGLDGPQQKLITVASVSQETPEAQRTRSSQYYTVAQW